MSEIYYQEALQHKIFNFLSEAADELDIEAYAIGGFVRDFF
jgi:tRNA nucleotidyltransferase (CCA-adding enzyme)